MNQLDTLGPRGHFIDIKKMNMNWINGDRNKDIQDALSGQQFKLLPNQ